MVLIQLVILVLYFCRKKKLSEIKSAHFTVCQKPWGCWGKMWESQAAKYAVKKQQPAASVIQEPVDKGKGGKKKKKDKGYENSMLCAALHKRCVICIHVKSLRRLV